VGMKSGRRHLVGDTPDATIRQMRICFIGDSFINGTGDDTWHGLERHMLSSPTAQTRHHPLYRVQYGHKDEWWTLFRKYQIAGISSP
jgi:hypothetical protein